MHLIIHLYFSYKMNIKVQHSSLVHLTINNLGAYSMKDPSLRFLEVQLY